MADGPLQSTASMTIHPLGRFRNGLDREAGAAAMNKKYGLVATAWMLGSGLL